MSERDDIIFRVLGAVGMTLIVMALLGMIFMANSEIRDLQRRMAIVEQRK
jgi:hypothetical protein